MTGDRIRALDGVRGLAVLAVVAFHLAVPGMSGGWVGVDVFFVLSGFLITSLLLDERRRCGRVSLRAFWARRARRLLPAVLVLVAGVAVTAAVLGRPERYTTLRGDATATLAYVANWRFIASDQSYFATFEPSPLRHTWSLAIEEQFYVLWPLAFIVLLSLVRRRSWQIALLAVAAVASALWMRSLTVDGVELSRAYYGSDTRATTILLGCIAAFAVDAVRDHRRAPAVLARASGPAVAIAGTALVGVAVLVPDDSRWLYAGGFGAVALVAAVLVVGAAHVGSTAAGRVLGTPLLVRAGLISYSLYLWHWPVIVFSERVDLPRAVLVPGQFVLAVALAELSYRFVEQPIRTRRLTVARPALVSLAGVGAIGLLVAVVLGRTDDARADLVPEASSGTVVARPPAAPTAVTPVAEKVTSTTTSTTRDPPVSTDRSVEPRLGMAPPSPRVPSSTAPPTTPPPTTPPPTTPPPTLPPAPAEPPDVLLLGDSVVWTVAGNPPPEIPFAVSGVFHAKCDIVGDRIFVGSHVNEVDPECQRWPERWSEAIDAETDAVIVMLGLRQLFDLDVAGQRLAVGSPEWDVEYRAAVRRALGLIRAEAAAPVFWFDVPCYTWEAEGTAGEEHDAARLQTVNAVLRDELATDPGVTVIDYGPWVCQDTAVIESMRPDGAHLTVEATHELWRWLEPTISSTLAARR